MGPRSGCSRSQGSDPHPAGSLGVCVVPGDAPSHGKWGAAREACWGCGLCCCGQMCEMC